VRTAAAASTQLLSARPYEAEHSEPSEKRNQPARTDRHVKLAAGGAGLGRWSPPRRATDGGARLGSLRGPEVGSPASAGRVAGATVAP